MAMPEPKSASQRADTTWFRDAKWGVFCHYLLGMFAPNVASDQAVETWNNLVDGFDVHGLARQLAEVKAGYFLITLGQNEGYFLSPNATYDSIVGYNPSHCSRRDLVADLINALAPYNIPLMAYLPCLGPMCDRSAVEALKCTPPWSEEELRSALLDPAAFTVQPGVDRRLTEFQRNWEAIIREWSLRFGKNVHGWWFDGAYRPDLLYSFPDAPNFASFAAAAKAGNPDSLVAWNPGGLVLRHQTEYEDYTAGEICCGLHVPNDYEKLFFPDGLLNGARLHVMNYQGTNWGQANPRFPNELIIGYTKLLNKWNGVVTWELRGTPEGLIPDDFLCQLQALRDATR
jgi:hypothetical protein